MHPLSCMLFFCFSSCSVTAATILKQNDTMYRRYGALAVPFAKELLLFKICCLRWYGGGAVPPKGQSEDASPPMNSIFQYLHISILHEASPTIISSCSVPAATILKQNDAMYRRYGALAVPFAKELLLFKICCLRWYGGGAVPPKGQSEDASPTITTINLQKAILQISQEHEK